MRTRDKVSIAALAASGATLVAVIFAPAPSAPSRAEGFSSERILLSASAEQHAVLKYRSDLDALDKGIEPLRKRFAGAQAPRKRDDREVIRREVARELARRWREFQGRLKEIRK